MGERTPLYGHTSEATAYLIDDYPCGRQARCQKKVWIEYKKTFGFRLVYRTTKAKPSTSWCAVKPGGYSKLAMCLYIDGDTGYVEHDALYEGSSIGHVKSFCESFPGAVNADLVLFANLKAAYIRRRTTQEMIADPAALKAAEAEAAEWSNIGLLLVPDC